MRSCKADAYLIPLPTKASPIKGLIWMEDFRKNISVTMQLIFEISPFVRDKERHHGSLSIELCFLNKELNGFCSQFLVVLGWWQTAKWLESRRSNTEARFTFEVPEAPAHSGITRQELWIHIGSWSVSSDIAESAYICHCLGWTDLFFKHAQYKCRLWAILGDGVPLRSDNKNMTFWILSCTEATLAF